jgi:hypothetical protein
MAEDYLTLSRQERLEALGVAATESGRPVHLLEKDIWVVWAIDGLFSADFGKHLVFKGGTSLSKAYDVIGRFLEDIDVTYDVRELIPELVGEDGPIPKSNSQAQKWRDAIDEKLPAWVRDTALPAITKHVADTGVDVIVTAKGTNIYIDYDPLAKGKGYVPPRVTVEFGARSTGEPCEERPMPSRDSGGKFTLNNPDDGTPITEMFKLGEPPRRDECKSRSAARQAGH